LQKLVFEDAGDYICRTSNAVSDEGQFSESHPVKFVISGPPHLYLEPETRFETFVETNTSLELMFCGEPKPDVKWSVGPSGSDDQVSLHAGTRHDRLQAESLVMMSSHVSCYIARLNIFSAHSSDSEVYHVRVENIHGKEELAIQLVVQGKLCLKLYVVIPLRLLMY
jgi:hypothetical protein